MNSILVTIALIVVAVFLLISLAFVLNFFKKVKNSTDQNETRLLATTFPIIISLSGAVFFTWISFKIHTMEILDGNYLEIKSYVEQFPELEPLTLEALANDKKVTYPEFKFIKTQVQKQQIFGKFCDSKLNQKMSIPYGDEILVGVRVEKGVIVNDEQMVICRS